MIANGCPTSMRQTCTESRARLGGEGGKFHIFSLEMVTASVASRLKKSHVLFSDGSGE
jgi:hypothetical protein